MEVVLELSSKLGNIIGGIDENVWEHDPDHGRSNRNWAFPGRGVFKRG
jgi:hypothetical protein